MAAIDGELLLRGGPDDPGAAEQAVPAVEVGGCVEEHSADAVVQEAVVLGPEPVVVGEDQRGPGAELRGGVVRFSAE